MFNTLRTTLGFITSILEKYTPLQFSGSGIKDTYNYLKINDQLATSGQPTEAQFRLIHTAGYKTVINLAPESVLENSLTTEAALLSELGIEYVHIPVEFNNPTEQDFTAFVNSMQAVSTHKVWVHCAANMRVSAFIYRYRCGVLGEDEITAKQALQQIWEPVGVWKTFVARHNS